MCGGGAATAGLYNAAPRLKADTAGLNGAAPRLKAATVRLANGRLKAATVKPCLCRLKAAAAKLRRTAAKSSYSQTGLWPPKRQPQLARAVLRQ